MDSNEVIIQLGGITGSTNGYLTIDKEIPLSLTFSVAEIQDISKKNSSSSKTVSIVGVGETNVLLGNLFDLNVTNSTFNINKKVDCIVYVNGSINLRGYFQLQSVKKVAPNVATGDEQIEYTGQIFENKVSLLDSFGAGFLHDLDFSAYNHIYSGDTILAASANTPVNVYCYPQMYSSVNAYTIEDYRPAIFVTSYLDALFKSANKSYTMTPAHKAFINKLIIPYNGDYPTITEEDRTNREFKSSISAVTFPLVYTNGPTGATSTIPTSFVVPYNDDSSIVAGNFDNGNNYNVNTYTYTVPDLGDYDFAFALEGSFKISAATDGWLFPDQPGFGSYVGNGSFGFQTPIQYRIIKNNTNTIAYGSIPIFFPTRPNALFAGSQYAPGPDISGGTQYDIPFTISTSIPALNLFPGDTLKVTLDIINAIPTYYDGGTVFGTWTGLTNWSNQSYGSVFDPNGLPAPNKKVDVRAEYIISSNTSINNYFRNYAHSSNVLDGQVIQLNKFIPQNIKKKDFFSSLVSLFNWYITQDPENESNFHIYTRDEFYDTNDYVDWSNKIDRSSEINVTFLGELQNKKLKLQYSEGKDLLNQQYKLESSFLYSEQQIEFDNDFITGEKVIKVIFESTPLTKDAGNKVVSYIDTQAPKTGIRILYLGDMLPCDPFTFKYLKNGAFVTETKTAYKYAGHFDNPYVPVLDLSFGSNIFLFYREFETVTNNTLFNIFYYNYITQINSGKLLTASFNLNDVDIANLDFRKKIWIKSEDSYFILNKVENYDPVVKNKTKVQLIKIDSGLQNKPKKLRIKGGVRSDIEVRAQFKNSHNGDTNGGIENVSSGVIEKNNQSAAIKPGVVLGERNITTNNTGSVIITGSDNYMDNAYNSVIMNGSGNTVLASGVLLFGVNDAVVTEPNIIRFNNVLITANGTVIPLYNDVEMGEDRVFNLFSSVPYNDINSGQDAVKSYGSTSPIWDINSGQDKTN